MSHAPGLVTFITAYLASLPTNRRHPSSSRPQSLANMAQHHVSFLEKLPNEIIELICSFLGRHAIISLWRCKFTLGRRLGRHLTLGGHKWECLLKWAIQNNDLALLREVVPNITTELLLSERTGRSSPLILAARRNHPETFALLMRMGCNLDDWSPLSSRELGKRIRDGGFWGILLAILDADSGPLVFRNRHFDLSLAHCIRAGAPVEVVKRMIDCGADLNTEIRDWKPLALGNKKGVLSPPLPAAIERGDCGIADLLLRHGADIHGPTKGEAYSHRGPVQLGVYDIPGHVPIVMAVKRLKDCGCDRMLNWCLANGADINCVIPVPLIYDRRFDEIAHCIITPLLWYMRSLDDRKGKRSNLFKALRLLVENGASPERVPESAWPDLGYLSNRCQSYSAIQPLLQSNRFVEANFQNLPDEQRVAHEALSYDLVRYMLRLGTGHRGIDKAFGRYGHDPRTRLQRRGASDSRALRDMRNRNRESPSFSIVHMLFALYQRREVEPDP